VAGEAKESARTGSGDNQPSASCLAAAICTLKERLRWRTPAWSSAYCERIASNVLAAAKQHSLPAALIVAVMINESSLNAYATRVTMKGNTVYARDGGLMGLRCIVDSKGRCMNGRLRGMQWSEVLNPSTNIALGAAALAYWRDVGGVMPVKASASSASGTGKRIIYRRCLHENHAFWAHYNHGERYLDHGRARHYPHRIAVLYYALLRALNLDTSALTSMRIGVSDAGRKPRTPDHPVEARELALCRSISSIGPVCRSLVTEQELQPAHQTPGAGSRVCGRKAMRTPARSANASQRLWK
jgi:hypothetical protein